MTEYHYRIMQRAPGGSWEVWMGKEYGDLEKAQAGLKYVLDLSRFFRWNREHKLQSRPIESEWSDVD
jgi:hypothetical protein